MILMVNMLITNNCNHVRIVRGYFHASKLLVSRRSGSHTEDVGG